MKSKYIALSLSIMSITAFAATDRTRVEAKKNIAQPDNSGMNQRDRAKNAVTSDQQLNQRSDLKLTQMIRRDIVADKALSTYAHNVKIISADGKIYLRGPVRSMEEKNKIAMSAARVAGNQTVVNELEIAP